MPDKEPVPRIYKNSHSLIINTQSTKKKSAKDLNRHFSKDTWMAAKHLKLSVIKKCKSRDVLVIQWLRPHAPNAGSLNSILGQGTRSHILQLRPGGTK